MRRAVLATVILATIVLVTTIARAEPPGLVIATPLTATPWSSIQSVDTSLAQIAPAPVERSYRWQIVLADVSALAAAVVVPAITDGGDDHARAAFVGTYVFGAPMIHAANGHGRRAIGSLALRVGLPLVGSWIGQRIQGEPDCPPDANLCGDSVVEFGLIFGVTAGVLTAAIADTWFLARPERMKRRGWAPIAGPTTGGAMAGVAGNF